MWKTQWHKCPYISFETRKKYFLNSSLKVRPVVSKQLRMFCNENVVRLAKMASKSSISRSQSFVIVKIWKNSKRDRQNRVRSNTFIWSWKPHQKLRLSVSVILHNFHGNLPFLMKYMQFVIGKLPKFELQVREPEQ